MTNHNHPFHLVTNSPWPIINAFCLMNLMMSMITWFYLHIDKFLYLNLILLIIMMSQWWRDVIRESTFQGNHTFQVINLLKFSMILFIISEVFFFISFFWTFFHSSINPSFNIGMEWPPKNIITFDPYEIPMLNSLVLIYSGIILTWSHFSLLNNKMKNTQNLLLITILFGFYFSFLQYDEYMNAYFCFNDSIYGSIFFMMTGFHGFHVIIGALMLLTCLIRFYKNHFTPIHHFHFEAASWYWHFVDMIWMFLYISLYWWN